MYYGISSSKLLEITKENIPMAINKENTGASRSHAHVSDVQ